MLRAADTTNPRWSPDGRHIVFDDISGDGHIALLDLATGTTVDLGGGYFPSWSPDGERIAFVSHNDSDGSDVYTIARDGSEPIRLTTSPEFKTMPSWSPDGASIVFWILIGDE